jgi:hypothetical protein
MAAISMTFALHSALKVSPVMAILFAVAWGLAIMSLDRWLVASLVRQRNKFGYIILALPRVALGILFGLIISTPFTLQVFAPEIQQQISATHLKTVEATDKTITNGPLAKQVAAYRAEVDTDEEITGSGGMSPVDPAISKLQQQLSEENAKAQSDYRKWQCQLYGGPGCPRGTGPLADAAQKEYADDEEQASRYRAQLAADEQQRVQNAKATEGPAAAQLAVFQNRENALEDRSDSTTLSNSGLLAQLHALDQVTAGDGTLQAARWLLFLFFTAIEVLPVLTKVLINLGPESGYERQLAAFERECLEFGKSVIPEIVRQASGARLSDAGVKLANQEKKETVNASQNGHGGTAQSRYRQGRL